MGAGHALDFNTCDDSTLIDTIVVVLSSCKTDTTGQLIDVVAYDDDSGCGMRRSRVEFLAENGTEYFVLAGSKKSADGSFEQGQMVVELLAVDPVAAHKCSAAVEIASLPAAFEGSTIASEPVASVCHDGAEQAGVWYRVKGTGKALTAHTCNTATDFDTVLDVYIGCDNTTGAGSTCEKTNDDSCGVRSVVTWETTAGQDYFVLVTGSGGARGRFVLLVEERGYSAHGRCSEAVEVSAQPFEMRGSTAHLPELPNACHDNHARTGMWFHVQGLTSDLIAMTCESNNTAGNDTIIDVFTSCDAATGSGSTCYASNDDYCGSNSAVVLSAEHQEYYVLVTAYQASYEGVEFTLTVQSHRNQTNDRCWQAEEIRELPAAVSGTTADITYTTTMRCTHDTNSTRHGAWYVLHGGEEARLVTLSTCNAENVLAADIEVYNQCISDVCIARGVFNESGNNCTNATFLAEPGRIYNFCVPATENATGAFYSVDVHDAAGNANAQCDNATDTGVLPYYTAGFTGTSRLSYSSCEGQERQGQWYRIVGTGHKIVATTVATSTTFDTLIELYSGCPTEENKTCLMWNDDDSRGSAEAYGSTVEWQSTNGTAYWLFVRGYEAYTGTYGLYVYEVAEPVNSHCSGALPLLPKTPVLGINTYATPSNASCQQGTRKGLWYKFTADSARYITLETCDPATHFETEIEVYLNCTEAGGERCVNHNHDRKCSPGTSLTFVAANAVEYYVFVTGARTDVDVSGHFRLTMTPGRNYTPPVTPSDSSSGSNWLGTVEIALISLGAVWLVAMLIGVACWIRNSRAESKYRRMIPDGLDVEQSPTAAAASSGAGAGGSYVAPAMDDPKVEEEHAGAAASSSSSSSSSSDGEGDKGKEEKKE